MTHDLLFNPLYLSSVIPCILFQRHYRVPAGFLAVCPTVKVGRFGAFQGSRKWNSYIGIFFFSVHAESIDFFKIIFMNKTILKKKHGDFAPNLDRVTLLYTRCTKFSIYVHLYVRLCVALKPSSPPLPPMILRRFRMGTSGQRLSF